jgi:hypothetical protein
MWRKIDQLLDCDLWFHWFHGSALSREPSTRFRISKEQSCDLLIFGSTVPKLLSSLLDRRNQAAPSLFGSGSGVVLKLTKF